jgi:hypothetical protein
MQIADATAHRALAYVSTVQRHGHLMGIAEFEAYMKGPGRRPGIPGKGERTVVTSNVERAIVNLAERGLQPLLQGVADVLELERRQVPATPGVPGERVIDWLARLGCLAAGDGRVRITPLGEAILGNLEEESFEREVPFDVVLDKGDELASGRVIEAISELGPCAVVDPYFSMDSLLQVVHSTEVDRILTGTFDAKKLAGLDASIPRVETEHGFEVRKSDAFHDRFVIPEAGPVWMLGTSFTGLGKRLSVMVQVKDDAAARAIRAAFEEAWGEAQAVGRPPALSEPQAEDNGAEAAGTRD